MSCCNPGYCCGTCNFACNVTPCYQATGSPAIGVPSQTPGTNPSTTNTPNPSASQSFLGSLLNTGAQWVSTVAKASVAPGSTIQRKVYGQQGFNQIFQGSGLIVLVIGIVVLVLALRK